ncbi:alpha/beta fold hydrolase [Nonomuraea sp. NPDC050227]|uniref:alpha/beta fold hydrolase n=1 Tax=Nonomuraea sp. NPDC050227 TaxID=3364360 RepID=UPI0037A03E93
MTIRSQRRGLSLLLAALTLTLGLTGTVAPASAEQSATAATEGTRAKPTVVLVHGVFADSSGWNATIAALQKAGFPVIAAANPLRDLAGDAAYVSSIIDTIPGPVIMVGHSYGGAAITNAARGHDNVKALVYVAAFAPDEGETALELAGKFPGSKLPPRARGAPLPGRDGRLHRSRQVPGGVRRRSTRLADPADGRHPASRQRGRTVRGTAASQPGRACRPGSSSPLRTT